MLAIPSPDVLLNLFASAAQILGLLALALGGGAFARRRSGLGGGEARPQSRWPFYTALVLLLATGASFLLYHLSVVDARNQRLRTNLVRKSTEANKTVGDTSLKTLSYSGQTKHPRGVSTEQLEQWITKGEALNLVDVREPEEIEMGQIPGTWARRYPDLQVDTSGLVVPGKQTILLCESGNRSSELCDWFFERGVDTRFMIGGYEKWVAEYRPMNGQRNDGVDIRATPDYPQKLVLLDTPEALRLVTQENALFVDVRYPEDFARDHLPGAVNVPLRKLRKDEVESALRGLPARPIVAVCYDKRSSFYGLLLGLRLHRLGADYRGRYTVPAEFTLPTTESEWVARWKADREGDTLFGEACAVLGGLLKRLAEPLGLVLAILLLVLGLRTAMLPFSLLAERDQWVQRGLSLELAGLRERWATDPVVWRRESLQRLRAAGVSPLRNLIGAVVQLLLFTFAFGAVDATAAATPTRLGWLELSARDPYGVLPLLFGGVLAGFVRLQQQDRRRWVLPLVFVAAMVALVWPCRAAVQLYLIASIGLMALQTVLQRRWLARRERATAMVPTPAPAALVPLTEAHRHPELGNKATRLGELLAAGMPVPAGFAVPNGFDPSPAELAEACRRAGVTTAAVRSSAQGEDSAESSMAGMFLSELDVAPQDVAAAIGRVRESYGGRPGGVVVQAFRRARFAGVLFTVDPGHAGRMLVELVAGGGEALVSGRATPQPFRYGRASGALVGDRQPPIPLEQLLELGRAAERRFGHPQDVEWVYLDDRFQLVQSRDITRLPGEQRGERAWLEAERHRVLGLLAGAPVDEPVLAQTEISELLPAPTTYSLALFESLWAPGGAVDRACRAAGFAYAVSSQDPPLLVTAFGRLFVDQRQWQRRAQHGLGALASFRMATAGQTIEDEWRAGLPALQRRLVQLEAIDPARLGDRELLQLAEELRVDFATTTYARAETINLAAEFFVGAARRLAERRGHDAAALLRDDDGNVVSRAFAGLGEDRPATERIDAFVAAFGHRAVHDFELSEPRYGEQPGRVQAMLRRDAQRPARSEAAPELPRVLGTAVQRARRFQALKEEAKHEAMRQLAVLRGLLCEIGRRFALGDGVFELLPEEVLRLGEPGRRSQSARDAGERAERRERLTQIEVPSTLCAAQVESLGDEPIFVLPRPGALAGSCVAGSREVTGVVRVLRHADRLGELQPGEILVTRCTDPCWLGAFPRAGGLVTEIGGWLSHAAIQAREHDLPTIVGVADACSELRTGELVTLRRDGTIERIADRRRPRREVDLTAELLHAGRREPVRIRDLGDDGAGIEVADAAALPRERFRLLFADGLYEATVAWRNCRRAGVALHRANGHAEPRSTTASPESN